MNNQAAIKSIKGQPYPLGISKQGGYVNFAVSTDAESCRIRLYTDKQSEEPVAVFEMLRDDNYRGVYCLALELNSAEVYEYTYEVRGREFVDDYARRLAGREHFGDVTRVGASITGQAILTGVRGCIDFGEFDWSGDRYPCIDYSDMIVYLLHVRGFTMHKSSRVSHRGTFRGITEKIDYMKELGINSILLMPCFEFNEICEADFHVGAPRLTDNERRKGAFASRYIKGEDYSRLNYWGYGAKACYFAPKSAYAASPSCVCTEFKQMVKELHSAGIEVLLEMDFAKGTSKMMMLDCLKFWVGEYHIDGFRINTDYFPSELAACDSYLSAVKLIGQGWNSEAVYGREYTPEVRRLAACNDGFCQDIRRFLKGDEAQAAAAAARLRTNEETIAQINYITDHDGFTLQDLYSYDVKHNEANGESNTDGREINFSWNCGIEGVTGKKKILELRHRMVKNAFAILLLSQGTPMLRAGDEFYNTQFGNNNPYCCDNETGWLTWSTGKACKELREYVSTLIALRRGHNVLHNKIELKGLDYINCGTPDISFHGTRAWYPDYSNYSRTLGMLLCGSYAATDNSFYIIFNMHWEPHEFDLPSAPGGEWRLLFATAEEKEYSANDRSYSAGARSIAVFIN